MGGSGSKPYVYPPRDLRLDALFTDIGCVAISEPDFKEKRLERAPFFTHYFEVSTKLPKAAGGREVYTDDVIIQKTVEHIQTNKPVVGPVYMLTAIDNDRKLVRVYLMFPSMQRNDDPTQNRATYTKANIYNVSTAHLWMYHLLYGLDYNIKPYSSCTKRLTHKDSKNKDALIMIHGCYSDSSDECRQSEKAHRGMRLYESGKIDSEYPIGYYHSYMINPGDGRVKDYITTDTTVNKLVSSKTALKRNVLTPHGAIIPGCRYALVSDNQRFFLVLSKTALSLFRNDGKEDYTAICAKRKIPKLARAVSVKRLDPVYSGYMANMFIEGNQLSVYSTKSAGADEKLTLKLTIAPDDNKEPVYLVLTDEGKFKTQTATGNTLMESIDFANARNENNKEFEDASVAYNKQYDINQRLLDLKSYLQLNDFVKTIVSQSENGQDDDVADATGATDVMPPYSYTIDYYDRLKAFYEYMLNNGRITQEEYDALVKNIDGTKETLFKTSTELMGYLDDWNAALIQQKELVEQQKLRAGGATISQDELLGWDVVADKGDADVDDETYAKQDQEKADKAEKERKEKQDKRAEQEKASTEGADPDATTTATTVFTKSRLGGSVSPSLFPMSMMQSGSGSGSGSGSSGRLGGAGGSGSGSGGGGAGGTGAMTPEYMAYLQQRLRLMELYKYLKPKTSEETDDAYNTKIANM